jgi:hypothetical protein
MLSSHSAKTAPGRMNRAPEREYDLVSRNSFEIHTRPRYQAYVPRIVVIRCAPFRSRTTPVSSRKDVISTDV